MRVIFIITNIMQKVERGNELSVSLSRLKGEGRGGERGEGREDRGERGGEGEGRERREERGKGSGERREGRGERGEGRMEGSGRVFTAFLIVL